MDFIKIFLELPNGGGVPNVMERSLQKNFLDALLTAAAEPEAVKINKKIADEHFLLDHATPVL